MKRTNEACLSFALLLVLLGACVGGDKSCKTEAQSTKIIINPNKNSELALLMRAMYADAENIKIKLLQGEDISVIIDHSNILTAQATEPEKATSAEYKAFAQVYLETVNALKACRPDQQEMHYRNMISQCKNCHQALCPGPIVRINKLEF